MVGGNRRFGKKEVGCAHRPSFFSYLPPQKCVDLSNQMYISQIQICVYFE
ncbi:hypothetical protein HMPREF0083_00346 [Aneurinibacillus aneurinilyticus ATCC 12856]|uniref:Uncharacterized protein n=1 Tax=Aneurinibacillus aneurinilyticus ATCC 12856 TaxID=649747 RepID=U1X998_ANEAE|nr:hypothetical protein HMPREF0083_00346 [Aneurinibacillus aneurinilyticus ATCC 12856]